MKAIKNFRIDQVPMWRVVAATTSAPDYEMDRTLFVEHHPDWGEYTIIHGAHCSCYGFDETEWDATVYTKAQLLKLMVLWERDSNSSERAIAPLVIRYLEAK